MAAADGKGMSVVVRTVIGGLVLAVPAAVLAAALIGPRAGRARIALRLGVVAAVPGLVALVWLQGRHDVRAAVRVTVLLVALIPGYVVSGWMALRMVGTDRRPASTPSLGDTVPVTPVEESPAERQDVA